jgi:DNA-binding protein HU-beta
VNKSQLIGALAGHFEGNKKKASDALDAILDTVTREVAKGEKVAITGFGAFEKVVRPSRMVRNPRTGERKRAKKTAVPKFKAGAYFKDVVSGDKKLPKAVTAKKSAGTTKKAASKSTAKRGTASTSTAKKSSTAKRSPATTKSTARKATAKASSSSSGPSRSTAKKGAAKTTSTARKAPSTARKTTKRAAKKS